MTGKIYSSEGCADAMCKDAERLEPPALGYGQEPFVPRFGPSIRAARERQNLSLSEAADLIGCTKAHVWDLEQEKSQNPTIKTLAGIAVTYRMPLSYLADLAAICAPGVEQRAAAFDYMQARARLKGSDAGQAS